MSLATYILRHPEVSEIDTLEGPDGSLVFMPINKTQPWREALHGRSSRNRRSLGWRCLGGSLNYLMGG